MTARPLAVGLRVTRRDPGHTHFDMFAAAPAPGIDVPVEQITRGRVGDGLCMRTYEFDAFVAALGSAGVHVQLHTLRRAHATAVLAVDDIAAVAAWLVDEAGYPLVSHFGTEPPPDVLQTAIVDHVWREGDGDLHDGMSRDEVAEWLAAEGRWWER